MSMSHNDRLGTIGESTRSLVRRILAVWERADRNARESGAQWYVNGGRTIDSLAAETGHKRTTVAAVISHLSPRTTWQRNVEGARSLLLTGAAPGCIGTNVERARMALDSDDPMGTLNGPKTSRFARNLLGDGDAVTVDVWALRVALNDRADAALVIDRVGMYEAVEHAYRVAADRVGVDAATIQATTWIVARNGRAH